MAVVNKPRPRATPSDSVCLLPKIPGTYYLLHEWAWYFYEPKASENAVHECNNRDAR